jgi:RNA polymerase sigma-70 factor (ECF subfamily)
MDRPSEQAVRSLVALQYGFVWRVLRGFGLSRADADDAAQQVFMIAARKLEHIVPGRERSFLYGAALRVANNARRTLRRRRELPGESGPERAEPFSAGPERQVELVQARALLAEILAELPDHLRRVLVLAEIEQLEISEIAALERLAVGTAASRLRVARERFHVLLEAAADRNPFSSAP